MINLSSEPSLGTMVITRDAAFKYTYLLLSFLPHRQHPGSFSSSNRRHNVRGGIMRYRTYFSLGSVAGLVLFWMVGLAWLRGCPVLDRDSLIHF